MRQILYIFLKIIPFVLIVVSHEYKYKSNQIMTVSIYYSTFSPASKSFIINQLYPAYSKLGQYLKLDFLPYGVTNMTVDTRGSYIFICARGPKNCEGNVIQTCALNQTQDDKVKLQFVYCFMMNSKTMNATENCAEESNLDSRLIQKCKAENSKRIMLRIGERARQELPVRYTLPKVKLDGKFVSFAGKNFLDNLCEILRGIPECQNVPIFRRYVRKTKGRSQVLY